MTPHELQLKQEIENDAKAAAERLESLLKEADAGSADLPRASKLIARLYADVRDRIDAELAAKTSGVSGKFKNWLRAIPSEVAAVIAIRECITQCTYDSDVIVQDLAIAIGRLCETEVLIREAEKVNPVYMGKIHEQVKEHNTTSKRHLRAVYSTAYERVMKGCIDSTLTNVELVHIGKIPLHACVEVGLVVLNRRQTSQGTLVTYELADEIREFLTGYDAADVRNVMDRTSSAMICPPDPWTNLYDGGYLSNRRKSIAPLLRVSDYRRSLRQEVREAFTASNMPQVFSAINYLQSIAFELHKPTVDAILRVWGSGGGVMGVPTKNPPPKPEFPFSDEWSKADAPPEELAVFDQWKRRAATHYDAIREHRGHVMEISGFIRTTAKYDGPMWFPTYMDSRSRTYYRGIPNPQGSDMSKAAIHFHKKKPLGENGVFWLKVHIANSLGFDKKRFAARAAWVDANWEVMSRALDEPENHPDVWGTDSPWCAFSAAWELREALRSGNPAAYCTGVIGHMDATCSGLQHFSAMLRDPLGAKYVNLVQSQGDEKEDIYRRVGDIATEMMKRDVAKADVAGYADFWLKFGVPRKVAKKPVMTYVYSATLRGTVKFIQDFMESEHPEVEFVQEHAYDCMAYLGKKLFTGIAATVPAAADTMRWLRGVARANPLGKPMIWHTPLGFKVVHDYQDFEEKKVRIRSCGLSVTTVREFNDGTRPIPMANAIAPNLVHSLDASHMMLTANRMKALDLDFVGIHDSFGTHMCDVGTMHAEIRKAFVELYSGKNILSDFLWEVGGIGEVPLQGTFDLNQVLDSEAFFS